MDTYKQSLVDNAKWQKYYLTQIPQDTGITSPQGYNELPEPETPYLTSAAYALQGFAPAYTNPAAKLYSNGNVNQVLLSASQPQCDSGCLIDVTKPDPRVLANKPLYRPTVFKAAPGHVLPNPYNVTGMY
jgi:hypothetical protein